jgi:hypothetical protein
MKKFVTYVSFGLPSRSDIIPTNYMQTWTINNEAEFEFCLDRNKSLMILHQTSCNDDIALFVRHQIL